MLLPLYFDSSALLVFAVMMGKLLEARAKKATSSALKDLETLQPETCIIACASTKEKDSVLNLIDPSSVEAAASGLSPSCVDLDPSPTPSGSFVPSVQVSIPICLLQLGDKVVLRSGAVCPADGWLVSGGEVRVNESMLTGESKPVVKTRAERGLIDRSDEERGRHPRHEIIGGSSLLSGQATVRIHTLGRGTVLGRIMQLVEGSQAAKPQVQQFADRVASRFVPSVLALSGITFVFWLIAFRVLLDAELRDAQTLNGFLFALQFAIAVLSIACPCALGLATPTAVMVASGVGAKAGILVKHGDVFETGTQLGAIVLDKTGTLTKGRPALTQALLLVHGQHSERSKDEQKVLEKLRRLAVYSEDAHSPSNSPEPRAPHLSPSLLSPSPAPATTTTTYLAPSLLSPAPAASASGWSADVGAASHAKVRDPGASAFVDGRSSGGDRSAAIQAGIIPTRITVNDAAHKFLVPAPHAAAMSSAEDERDDGPVDGDGANAPPSLCRQPSVMGLHHDSPVELSALAISQEGRDAEVGLWRLTIALEACSDHPLAKGVRKGGSIRNAALRGLSVPDEPLLRVKDYEVAHGKGVAGTVEGLRVRVGKLSYVCPSIGQDVKTSMPAGVPAFVSAREAEGCSVVFVSVDGVLCNVLALADEVRTGARRFIRYLSAVRGLDVWICSGDSLRTTRAIARRVGVPVSRVVAEASPEDKGRLVTLVQSGGTADDASAVALKLGLDRDALFSLSSSEADLRRAEELERRAYVKQSPLNKKTKDHQGYDRVGDGETWTAADVARVMGLLFGSFADGEEDRSLDSDSDGDDSSDEQAAGNVVAALLQRQAWAVKAQMARKGPWMRLKAWMGKRRDAMLARLSAAVLDPPASPDRGEEATSLLEDSNGPKSEEPYTAEHFSVFYFALRAAVDRWSASRAALGQPPRDISARELVVLVRKDPSLMSLLPPHCPRTGFLLGARRKVCMVGDGLNDAPALSAADLGVSVGGSLALTCQSADCVLLKSDVRDLVHLLELCDSTLRTIRRNFLWALGFNAVGIPVAAGACYPWGVMISPLFCGVSMAMSSLIVISSSLLLRKTFSTQGLLRKDGKWLQRSAILPSKNRTAVAAASEKTPKNNDRRNQPARNIVAPSIVPPPLSLARGGSFDNRATSLTLHGGGQGLRAVTGSSGDFEPLDRQTTLVEEGMGADAYAHAVI